MKILIAMDSFKGSLSSLEAGRAAADGIRRVLPDAEICIVPLADGGEGTVDALIASLNGAYRYLQAEDPLGRVIPCRYGIVRSSGTAIMEMASAAGLTLLADEERNPLAASTFGVGQMIADAIRQGCRNFIIGIGGSATNDGGAGMLQALGFSLLDRAGKAIPRGALGLSQLAEIRTDTALPELAQCRFRIACDVTNPLCGTNGCSAVFGPQKGAAPEMIAQMDAWLGRYADFGEQLNPAVSRNTPGAGAAGGIGFGFLCFLNASLESGISLVMSECGLKEHMASADIIITGEGRLDGQSAMGKAPAGVARLAKEYGKPILALAGAASADAGHIHQSGVDAFFPVLQAPCTLSEAMDADTARRNTASTAEQVFRLITAITQHS